MWVIPRNPTGCIRSAAMFYVVPVATNVKTIAAAKVFGAEIDYAVVANLVVRNDISANWKRVFGVVFASELLTFVFASSLLRPLVNLASRQQSSG
eukprot:2546547-Pleurochrysis_carterae.AAC.1